MEGPVEAERAEFERAITELHSLLDRQRIDAWQPLGPAAIYTATVTVWLLIYQRLHAGASLSTAVHALLRIQPACLPANRRRHEATLSANSGAYSRARTRLKPEVTTQVADHIFTTLISAFPATLPQRRAFLIDGTTIKLAPTRALQAAFPPATNQHGSGVWPIAHLLVAHEIESGCALLPELGPKYGEQAVGETALVPALLARLPPRSIVIADRNFGIFYVFFHVLQRQHDALTRLTRERFEMLLRQAEAVDLADSSRRTWKVTWRPSKSDRRAHPELPPEAAVELHLHAVVVSAALTLYLATTWLCAADQAALVYGRRQDVETDIRNVKVSLNTENLPARSVAMLQKELAASFAAYNLVMQIRRLAARRAGVAPRRLSFARVWSVTRVFLLERAGLTTSEWCDNLQRVLQIASQHRLPNRPGRSFPRRAHPKRNKSTSGKRKPPSTG